MVSKYPKPMVKAAKARGDADDMLTFGGSPARHLPKRAPNARSYAGVLCVPWLEKYINISGLSAGTRQLRYRAWLRLYVDRCLCALIGVTLLDGY